jgi:PAS domain S-box-containing protein
MTWYFLPYAVILGLGAALALLVAGVVWSHRSMPGSVALTCLMLLVAQWSIASAAEGIVPGLEAKILWAKISYLGVVFVPLCLLTFAARYTAQDRWLRPAAFAALLIIPILTLILVATNELHRLIWSRVVWNGTNLAGVAVYEHGLAFWLILGYNYLLVLAATILLVRAVIRSPELYRGQWVAMLVGAALPWLGNLVYVSGLVPVPGLDLTPLAFALSGLVIAWAMYRYQLFAVVPVARDLLVERMDDGVIVLDDRDHLVDVNPAAGHLLGFIPAAVLGQTTQGALAQYPDLLACCGADAGTHTEVRLSSEPLRYVNVRLSPLHDHRGHFVGRLLMLTDITRRKEAEAAEHEQRVFATALRDSASVLNSSLNLDTVLDQLLDQVSRVLPYDAAAVSLVENASFARVARRRSYRSSLEAVPVGLEIADTPDLHQMATTRNPLAIPDTHADPHWLCTPGFEWIRSFVGAPVCEDDRIVGFLTVESATPGHYGAEDAAHLQAFADPAAVAIRNARLFAETSHRAEQMATLNRIGLAITSGLELNRVLEALYEQCRQVVAAECFYVALYDADTEEIHFPFFRDHDVPITVGPVDLDTGLTGRVLRSGHTLYVPDLLDTATPESQQVRLAGAALPRSFVAIPLVLRDEVLGVLSVQNYRPAAYDAADIHLLETIATQAAIAVDNARLYTGARRAREATEAANRELAMRLDELEARNQELDAFSHTVAHDLKNPLSQVLGFAELLAEEGDALPPEDFRHSLRVISWASAKMNNIIEELLLLAQVRRAEVAVVLLSMVPLVTEALVRLQSQCEELGAEVIWSGGAGWPLVMGHGAWIEEVWVNYISNALKYGGRPPRIEIGTTPEVDGMVCFWVHDNGKGLTSEEQTRLFAPFERISQTRISGYGLGLSIVRRIIEKLGGRVSVTSQVGQGSTFSFTLPAADQDDNFTA